MASFFDFLMPTSTVRFAPPSSSLGGTHPTHQQLWQIFQNVKNGVQLNPTEKELLDNASIFSQPITKIIHSITSFISNSAEEKSAYEIDSLTAQIMDRTLSSADALKLIEKKLLDMNQPTARESASLTKLIHSCLKRDGSFAETLSKFRDLKKRDPSSGELIDMVASFNREMLPKASLAGTVAGKVHAFELGGEKETDYEIKYNTNGYLEIRDGPVGPLDTSCRQVLSHLQRDEICEKYNLLLKNATYNNLGELFEFVNHVKKERRINGKVSLNDAYHSYHPDLVALFDKYHGGTCILLATKFAHELNKQGIKAQNLSSSLVGLNIWTTLPIPGTEDNPIKWMNYSNTLKGVDHTSSICFFKDENGKDGAIKFECSFEENLSDEIKVYSSTDTQSAAQQFLQEIHCSGSEDHPNRVADNVEIGKSRLKGRYKALVKNGKKTMGVDFLQDNFYINHSWAKAIDGFPFNEQGKSSIDLESLANPDLSGCYIINNVKVVISHREALRIILSKVSDDLSLPKDTEESLVLLAQIRNEFINEFALQPLPLIKAHYEDLLIISNKLCEIKKAKNETVEFCSLIYEYNEVIAPLYQDIGSDKAGKMIADFKEKVLNF